MKKFEIGDVVQKSSGIKGVVIGFFGDRVKVDFTSDLNPGRRGAFTVSNQLPSSLRPVGPETSEGNSSTAVLPLDHITLWSDKLVKDQLAEALQATDADRVVNLATELLQRLAWK